MTLAMDFSEWNKQDAVVFAVALLVTWVIASCTQAFLVPIPGPFLCKLTVWYLRWHQFKATREEFIEHCHKRYGDIVMITPTEISFRAADAIRDIFAKNKLDKDYSVLLEQWGETNLVSTQEAALHQARRKVVAPAYTAPAITSPASQNIFRSLIKKLESQIDYEGLQNKGSVNIFELFRWFATDLTSCVVYGTEHALNTLESQGDRETMQFILTPIEKQGTSIPILLVQWFPRFIKALTTSKLLPPSLRGIANVTTGMHRYSLETYKKKMAQPDLEKTSPLSHIDLLMAEFHKKGPTPVIPTETYIASDSLDHFFAGCLTAADGLSWLVWEMSLSDNRHRQLKLREELHSAGILPETEIQLTDIVKLPYLNAVLKETLRRHPPVPFSLDRIVKPGQEVYVMGHKIKPGMKASAQIYSVHRYPEVFTEPEDWNPERWEIPSDSVQSQAMTRYFWPFGSGQRMCIGMHVAWAEIRFAAAKIFSAYDVSLASEWFGDKEELLPDGQRSHLFPHEHNEPIIFNKLA
ncbi:cytochrome P450 [Bisporella sp. PMI_857]|nr:cytochrome P450 [Bisporella sp. PMI_857]